MALENQVTFAEVGNPKRVTQLTENTDVAGAYFLTEKVGESAAKKTSYATVESAVKSKVQSEYLQTLSASPASDKAMSEKLAVGELKKRDDKIVQLEEENVDFRHKTASIHYCNDAFVCDAGNFCKDISIDEIEKTNDSCLSIIDSDRNAKLFDYDNTHFNYNWRVIVEEREKFCGFPSIAKIGKKIIVAYRVGESHVDKTGSIEIATSSNYFDFTKKTIISGGFQDGAYYDFRDPKILKLDDNNVIIATFAINFGANGDTPHSGRNRAFVYKYRIVDNELTYVSRVEIQPKDSISNISTCGSPILYDGIIYLMCYDYEKKINYLYTSDDGGVTFLLKSELPTKNVTEASIVFYNGALYAHHRDGDSNAADGYNAIYPTKISVSYDRGVTWSAAGVIDFFYHGLHSVVVNSFIVTTGRSSFTNAQNEQCCLMVVRDNYEVFKSLIISDNNRESASWDSNYSHMIVDDDYIYNVYYLHTGNKHTINIKRINTAIIQK